jgi:hypothetical protein
VGRLPLFGLWIEADRRSAQLGGPDLHLSGITLRPLPPEMNAGAVLEDALREMTGRFKRTADMLKAGTTGR